LRVGFAESRGRKMTRRNIVAILGVISLAGSAGTQQVRAQQGADKKNKTTPLIFRLELNQMVPQTLSIPAGRYSIQVLNGLVLAELPVELADGKNVKLLSSKIKRQQSRMYAELQLNAGSYKLSVAGRPQWVSSIEVTK
jgi:hypothetical protein